MGAQIGDPAVGAAGSAMAGLELGLTLIDSATSAPPATDFKFLNFSSLRRLHPESPMSIEREVSVPRLTRG
jgi:hypothetical protein